MTGFVFISSNLIFQRFVASRAFEELETRHDLIYVALREAEDVEQAWASIGLAEAIAGKRLEWVPFYPRRYAKWKHLFTLSCLHYRDRSSSFAIRHEESFRDRPEAAARLERLAQPGIYDAYCAATERQLGLHPDILALTLRQRPDFFVLPSPGLDQMTDDVMQVANALDIPLLLLVAGWDNLSSKGLFHFQPTMMGVWGEQSKAHAVQVQGSDPERIFVVGAPHYEHFRVTGEFDRAAQRGQWGVPLEKPLILFAGTFRLFDETQVLLELEQAIESGALPDMHLIYRPHPWRTIRADEKSFYDLQWRHITMDPAMIDSYQNTKRGNTSDPANFLYGMDYLRQVYQTVDAVICPMSTVLLESMLFGLPILAVAFGDGKHSWSADKVSQMMHFKELYEIPEVLVCRDRARFISDVARLFTQIGDERVSTALRQNATYFVDLDETLTYGERVAALVDKMLAAVDHHPRYGSAGRYLLARHRLRHVWQNTVDYPLRRALNLGLRIPLQLKRRVFG